MEEEGNPVMSTHPHNRWSTLLAGFLLAAALALITAPSAPSVAALTSLSDCQAGPETECCTCGKWEGKFFCHPRAKTGGVVCRDAGEHCPLDQPHCWMPQKE